MVNYAVLGLGMMGEAIVFDILQNDIEAKVYGFEISDSRRNVLEKKFNSNRFKSVNFNLDLSIDPKETKLLSDFKEFQIDVAFGAIDYKYNLFLTQVCILSKVSFLDLGGNPEVVSSQKSLHNQALANNICIIPDCGLAPGMADVIAYIEMKKFDKLEECHIRVGGLPVEPKTILKYQQVFSIRGLTNEYLEDAIIIRDGKIQKIPSITEIEEIEFPQPFGILEAFQTSGGTSNLPELLMGKIKELTYKTIRYKGHAQFIQFLKEFDLLSSEKLDNFEGINARELIEYFLVKKLPKFEPDCVLMEIKIIGTIKGDRIIRKIQMIDYYDKDTNFSSMARTTAFPIAIIGQMIAHGFIDEKGVLAGEKVVPGEKFYLELNKRGIKFTLSDYH